MKVRSFIFFFLLAAVFLHSSLLATAAETTAASEPPPVSLSVLRVFGAMVLVIALFLGGVWLFKNWQRLAASKGKAARLKILEVRPLGGRQTLYVVGYDQQRMLLSSSPSGVVLVSHLPAADPGDDFAEENATPIAFMDALRSAMTKKG